MISNVYSNSINTFNTFQHNNDEELKSINNNFHALTVQQQITALNTIDNISVISGCKHQRRMIPPNNSMQQADSTQMTPHQLSDFVQNIQLNPRNANAYYNLALTIPYNGSIQLPDNTQITQQELFLKTIQLDPNHADAYHDLATTLLHQRKITLLNGTQMTQEELYLKAIELNSTTNPPWVYYYNLGLTLYPNSSVKLCEGITMTREELFNIANYFAIISNQ